MALKEVCIAARSFGPGRAQEGDIICIREPRGEVGKKEQADFLWLVMDEADLPTEDKIRKDGATRANIPLDSIKAAHANVDLDRVRDFRQKYQPFINPDPVTGRARAQVQASKAGGIQINDRNNA